LENFKKKLTQEFTREVHKKEDELNEKINRYHRNEIASKLDIIEQERLILEEEENQINRKLKETEALGKGI
jgi:hypothetical protein